MLTHRIFSIVGVLGLLAALAIAGFAVRSFVADSLDVRKALVVTNAADMQPRQWLERGSDSCTRDPCLIVEHEDNLVRVILEDYDPDHSLRRVQLETKFELNRDTSGELVSLIARHVPTPSLIEEPLRRNGVDIDALRRSAVIYEINGAGWFASATMELPYGVLSQYILDAFSKVDRAMGNETSLDELAQLAQAAANEVSARFGLAELSANARIAQIATGPVQVLTYSVAALALLFTILEIGAPRLQRVSNGLADLIPFTGFFGTLLGVAGGLRVLGQFDVTDDISKALALGKIGSSLSLAINTTILAIVVFGLVLVVQYAVRTLAGIVRPSPLVENEATAQ